MKKPEDVFNSIPRTPEEMATIRAEIAQGDLGKVIDKAHAHNKRLASARAIVRMMESDAFKELWAAVHEETKKLIDRPVSHIKGSPSKDQRFDPFGKLEELTLIQGGLEMLESQSMQLEIFRRIAKGEEINVEELEAKLKAI